MKKNKISKEEKDRIAIIIFREIIKWDGVRMIFPFYGVKNNQVVLNGKDIIRVIKDSIK